MLDPRIAVLEWSDATQDARGCMVVVVVDIFGEV